MKHAAACLLVMLSIPLWGMADNEPGELSGAGSEEYPYTIGSLDDLILFRDRLASGKYREKYKDKYFVLTCDIHINDKVLDDDGNLRNDGAGLQKFLPIGEDSYYCSFRGHFDGQGHTVYGLYIDTDSQDAGFFGYMYSGSISNLNFRDCFVRGKETAGVVLGRCREGEVSNCNVQGHVSMSGSTYQAGLVVGNGDDVVGCCAEGKVTVASIPDQYGDLWNCMAGGICGRGDWVYQCSNSATVCASGWCVAGGIAGSGRTISCSANYGLITTDFPNGIGGIVGGSANVWDSENHGIIIADVKGARIGGISGDASGNTTISGCVNYTDFIVDTDSVGVGGIVAYPEADRYTSVKIKSCKNLGNIEISGYNSYGGGISGKAYAASFYNCINHGDVTVVNSEAAGICSYATYHSNAYGCVNHGNIMTAKKGGGIFGHSADATVGCINYGRITGIGDDAVLGGLVGRCESSSCFIKYSINLGSVSKGDYVGGIVGSSAWGGVMCSCYNGGNISATRHRAWVGGLAGYAGFSIRDCYNVGDISVSGEGTLAGGLVGKIFCGRSQWSEVSNCFNMGNVNSIGADSYAGSILGKNDDTYGMYSTHLRNCYYLENTLTGMGYTDLMQKEHLTEPYVKECDLNEFAMLYETAGGLNSSGYWEQGLYHPVLKRYDEYSDEHDPQPLSWDVRTVDDLMVKIDLGRAFGNDILISDTTSVVCSAPNVLDISTGFMSSLTLSEHSDFKMPEGMNRFSAGTASYSRRDTSVAQTIVLPFDAPIPSGMSAWIVNRLENGVMYCDEVDYLRAGRSYIVLRSDSISDLASIHDLHISSDRDMESVDISGNIVYSPYLMATYLRTPFDNSYRYYSIGENAIFLHDESENGVEPFAPVAIMPVNESWDNLSCDFGNNPDGLMDVVTGSTVDVYNIQGIKVASDLPHDELSGRLSQGIYILSDGKRILIKK